MVRLSNGDFDWMKLIAERKKVEEELHDEFNEHGSIRSEGLLLTNWVDNLLKDCIVILTRSEKARSISRKVILEILADKGHISNELAEDIKRINQIRDQFGHTMRRSLIEERIAPIIENMSTVRKLKNNFKNWDTTMPFSEKITVFSLDIINILNDVFYKIKIPNKT